MRKAWLLVLLAPSALVWACGGDDTSNADGGPDAQGDTTTKPDTGSDTGTNETSTLDSGSTDTGSNPDAISIACVYPSDCVEGGVHDASYPPQEAGVVCCGTLQLSGTPPNCNFDSLTTKCVAPSACNSSIILACATDTVRGCESTAECTEVGYNHCCHANGFGDGGVNVCMSQQTAGLIGAQCF